jgi:hypothetical protein
MTKTTKNRLWFTAYAITMLIGFLVIGPMIDNAISDSKPYILVYESNYKEVSLARASKASCYVPIYRPFEADEVRAEETLPVYMDAVPEDMVQYVHYPSNWNAWYNIFNPNGIGPKLKTVLSWVNPILAALLIFYAFILWKQGKFKRVIDRLRGSKDD